MLHRSEHVVDELEGAEFAFILLGNCRGHRHRVCLKLDWHGVRDRFVVKLVRLPSAEGLGEPLIGVREAQEACGHALPHLLNDASRLTHASLDPLCLIRGKLRQLRQLLLM